MDPDDLPDYDDSNERQRYFEELLAADPDYEAWVEQSYAIHQSEQGEIHDR